MKQGFSRSGQVLLRAAAIVVAAGLAATQGSAQSTKSPSLFKANPTQREQPVRITSASLEVRDKERIATFTGDVHVIQGETDLRCSVLVVFYDNEQAKPAPASKSEKSNQKIRRMEARGAVIMTQKDQRAVGDHADFDVIKNTMLLTGNVVVTRGDDVLRGQRLFVDMTTGVSRMESDGGRVDMLIKSNTAQQPQSPPRQKRPN